MWKAFAELRQMGWLDGPTPRLVSVQAGGCAPVVRAFEQGADRVTPWPDASTVAMGLRVPSPFADALMLRAIRETGGTAVAVSEEDLMDGMLELAGTEGCFACPEGGATLAALRRLRASGEVKRGDRVILFNTGSGLKYPEAWRGALARRATAAGAGRGEARS
jgi:threonine synthase